PPCFFPAVPRVSLRQSKNPGRCKRHELLSLRASGSPRRPYRLARLPLRSPKVFAQLAREDFWSTHEFANHSSADISRERRLVFQLRRLPKWSCPLGS